MHISKLKFKNIDIDGKTLSVAKKVVRTKMCPVDVQLVVLRSREKPSKPYKYFLLFSSDRDLSTRALIGHYKHRWKIETAFRDAKQHFGFGHINSEIVWD